MSQTPNLPAVARKSVHRSRNYPGLSLQEALKRVQMVYDRDKRAAGRPEVVLSHVGLRPGSGVANRTLAAMKQYGLLDEKAGLLKVSDLAFRILNLSESSPDRRQAIQEAILRPAIIREVFDAYQDGIPSDANLRDFLIVEKGFNPDSVPRFVEVLKDNMALVDQPSIDYSADVDLVRQAEDRGERHGVALRAPSPAPSVASPSGDLGQIQFSCSQSGVALSYRGKVTKKILNKLIGYLSMELDGAADDDQPEVSGVPGEFRMPSDYE